MLCDHYNEISNRQINTLLISKITMCNILVQSCWAMKDKNDDQMVPPARRGLTLRTDVLCSNNYWSVTWTLVKRHRLAKRNILLWDNIKEAKDDNVVLCEIAHQCKINIRQQTARWRHTFRTNTLCITNMYGCFICHLHLGTISLRG
jgi:hypothetical protein